MKFLEGNKTYLVAAALTLCAVLEKVAGIDIPGFEIGDDWLLIVLGALGITTMRAGVAKVEQKVDQTSDTIEYVAGLKENGVDLVPEIDSFHVDRRV